MSLVRTFLISTPGIQGLLLALCLATFAFVVPAGAQGVPQELVGIQTQYFRALENVERKHQAELTKVRAEYLKQLQELGRGYVKISDQRSALAVKVEIKRLENPTGSMPAPGIEPPRELVDIREAFEEKRFQIEESQGRLMGDLAKKYLSQLEVWSKLYRSKGKPDSAKAVDQEIKRMQAALTGEKPAASTLTAAPKDKPAAPTKKPAETATEPADTEPTAVDPVDAALTATTEGDPELPTEDAADAAAAGTAPAAGKSPVPLPGLPTQPDTLVLKPGWQKSENSNRELTTELASILSPYGKSEANLGTFPGLVLYGKVRYLMPWAEARAALELDNQVPETGVIRTPGWPGADSLKFYSYKGKFDGFYTRMNIICDAADHVVTLQLTNDSSGMNLQYRPLLPQWKFYDYVLGRPKKIEIEGIWHKIFSRNLMGEFVEETDNVLNPNTPCLRIDTIYFDANLAVQSWGRWYVVRPFLDTLLYTCNAAQ